MQPQPARRRLKRRNQSNDRQAVIARLGLTSPPAALPSSPPAGLQTKHVEWLDRFVQHPGFGLTPAKVISVYRTAEWGWCQEQADLFEDIIENDGHLRSVIEARTLAVSGKEWQVLSGNDDEQSIRAAELLGEALKRTNFADAIAFIVGARYYGYSVTEIQWTRVGADVVPGWFITVPHRRISFDARDLPGVINETGTLIGEPLQPGRFVYATNGGGPITSRVARSGLMRTATWYALFKRWSWRDWVVYAEKFGLPMVLGTHDDNATEEQIAKLEDTVTNIGEDGQAIKSKDVEVEIIETANTDTNLHKQIIAEANTEISKLITGSTLTTDSGGPGSFALGKVHETRSFDLVVSDAKMVANLFQKQIAAPFLQFNGFAGAALPRLKIAIARETDPGARLKQFQLAQQIGVDVDSEQVREELQLRVPPSPERVLEPPAAAEPAPSGDQGSSLPSNE